MPPPIRRVEVVTWRYPRDPPDRKRHTDLTMIRKDGAENKVDAAQSSVTPTLVFGGTGEMRLEEDRIFLSGIYEGSRDSALTKG